MRRLLLIVGGVLLCAAASPAAQETSRPPSLQPAAPGVETIAPVALDAEVVAAMQAEIDARIEAGQKAAQALQEKVLAASGAERLALLRQSQSIQESLYLDILRIQARHTRAAGFVEAAQRIEAIVEARIEARENPASRVPAQKSENVRPAIQGGEQ